MNNDISKCLNINCTIKNSCLRFTATGSDRQCYSDFKQKEDGKCDHFIANLNNEIKEKEQKNED